LKRRRKRRNIYIGTKADGSIVSPLTMVIIVIFIDRNEWAKNKTQVNELHVDPPARSKFQKMAAALSATTSLKTKVFTLVLITADNYSRVLLGMKKRGFG
jgi:hypothetical protein